jgi:hypothetical protein
MYSAIAADVEIETDPKTQRDPILMKKLLSADKVNKLGVFSQSKCQPKFFVASCS